MELDASLSWLALALTPGLGSRLSARVLHKFGSPDGAFRASLAVLESCNLPAQAAQAMVKKESFKRAEKELDGVRKISNCRLLNTIQFFFRALEGLLLHHGLRGLRGK